MEYNFIEHWSKNEFISLCNELLSEGWTPQGGISATYQSSNSKLYAQAFVRPVK